MMRTTFLTAVVLVGFFDLNDVFSQKLSDPSIKGVAVAKLKGLRKDNQAMAFEFTHFYVDRGSSICIVPGGKKIRFRVSEDLFLMPYPGRGHAETPEEIAMLLQTAEKRFPQYRNLWLNLRRAWQNEFKRHAGVRSREQHEMLHHHSAAEQFRQRRNQESAAPPSESMPEEPSADLSENKVQADRQAERPVAVLQQNDNHSLLDLLSETGYSSNGSGGGEDSNKESHKTLLKQLKFYMDKIREYYQWIGDENNTMPGSVE
jgi:hypothetical protein